MVSEVLELAVHEVEQDFALTHVTIRQLGKARPSSRDHHLYDNRLHLNSERDSDERFLGCLLTHP